MASYIFRIRRHLGWLNLFIVSEENLFPGEYSDLSFHVHERCIINLMQIVTRETNKPSLVTFPHFSKKFFPLFIFTEIWFSPEYAAASHTLSTSATPSFTKPGSGKVVPFAPNFSFQDIILCFSFPSNPSSCSADDHASHFTEKIKAITRELPGA